MSGFSRRDWLKLSVLWALAGSATEVLARGKPGDAPGAIDEIAKRFMAKYDVPGMSLCFMKAKEVVYSNVWGVSNKSTHMPVEENSLFRIASNSKAFTATAILLLVEAGKLNLHAQVFGNGGVLNDFSIERQRHQNWIVGMTVYQLLTHTCGGWGNEQNDPMFEKPGMNHQALIQWTLDTHMLQHPPGQHYDYSNFGYCVLGRVIERVSGMPYARFVHEHILRKINNQDMRIGRKQAAPGEVTYYGQSGENPYDFPIARMDAHGGWIAKASDMTRLMTHLFLPRVVPGAQGLLSPQSLKIMTAGTKANPEYGCGLAINKEGNAWHAGSLPGTSSLMAHVRDGYAWAGVLNTRSTADAMGSDFDDMFWRMRRVLPEADKVPR